MNAVMRRTFLFQKSKSDDFSARQEKESSKNTLYSLNDPRFYLNLFQLQTGDIDKIISAGMETGATYCDIFFQKTITNDFALEDNRVSQAFSSVDFGAGVRVLFKDQCGYCFTQDLRLKSLLAAARTAALIAASRKVTKPQNISPAFLPPADYLHEELFQISPKRKIRLLQKLNEIILKKDSRILKTNILFSDETSWILVASSAGILAFDYRPLTELAATIVMENKNQKESNNYSLSYRSDFSVYDKNRLNDFAETLISRTAILFDARKPRGGELPLVLAPGSSGILLHEAIGHGLEADFNRKKISIFSGKIGKRIAPENVTIVDDGTLPQSRGSSRIDDEGFPTKHTVLVENGILVSYLHDYLSSEYFRVNPTGNGRRESFRRPPLPRMCNTFMLPGSATREEIIKSISYGIYAETFTNGQVQIGAGDFTFYVKNGFLIENGKITAPIKDVNIIGNGPDILTRIELVANDLKISSATWTCGKDGQGVPVSQGLPTVKISRITVGGD